MNLISFIYFISALLPGAHSSIISEFAPAKGKFDAPGQICSGVNIHFTSGHEKDLDMIAAAGFRFIRMDFVWHNIEVSRGIYNWKEYDELTANLNRRGLRAIYILDYSNPLYEGNVESKDPITGEVQRGIAAPRSRESVAAFSKWAAAAAEHFKGNNIVWEIWNEPNITFWKPAPDVNQYIALAKAACKAIRAVVPGSVIIGPATSQIPYPFIESFLASGILENIDAVSVHPYRDYAIPPESVAADYAKLHDLIARYSPSAKKDIPVISSEWGYASATKGLPVEKQASYAVRMQLINLLSGVPVSIWYDWKNDGNDPGNFEHNCGTVTSDLMPKPAYIGLRTLNEQLRDYVFMKRIKLENEGDYAVIFKDQKGRLKLCAWTTGDPHAVVIDKFIQSAENCAVTDWKGDSSERKSNWNRMVLILDGMPQYITLK